MVSWNNFLKKLILKKKKSAQDKKAWKLSKEAKSKLLIVQSNQKSFEWQEEKIVCIVTS